jgi:glycine/D-amino acid oxidase-like deaminating enzyme
MLHGRREEDQIHTERKPDAWPWDRPLIPPPPQAQALVEKARRMLVDGDLLAVQSAAASVRALAFDGLPVVGPVPGKPGLYAIVTHSGIGLAPLLGRLAAGEISGERSAALESFRPDRFLDDDWRTRSSPMRDARPSDAPTN